MSVYACFRSGSEVIIFLKIRVGRITIESRKLTRQIEFAFDSQQTEVEGKRTVDSDRQTHSGNLIYVLKSVQSLKEDSNSSDPNG